MVLRIAIVCLCVAGCSLDWDGLSAGEPDGGPGDASLDGRADGMLDGGGDAPDARPTTCTAGEPGCPAFVDIALGSDHGCGVRGDGRVTCWGWNDSGQLGQGDRDWRAEPQLVPGLFDVVQIAAGDRFSCALDERNEVWCWGQNYAGQLGRGSATGYDVDRVAGLSEPTSIAAANDHACAIAGAADEVWCWGRNDHRQIGAAESVNDSAVPIPVLDSGGASLDGVRQLALGERFSCALRTSGQVLCWGANDASEQGDGSGPGDGERASPVLLAETATRIFAGARHACALTASDLYCWGSTAEGQLQGTTEYDTPRPQSIEGVRDAALGAYHTCVLRDDGEVLCYGQNRAGELGRGTVTRREVAPVAVAGVDDTEILVAGGELDFGYTCAQSTTGALRCWGYSGHGQLGDEAPRVSESAAVAPALFGQVFAGFDKTCAWSSSGPDATCVGSNVDGEMGDGSEPVAHASGRTPAGSLTTFRDVGIGANHVCAIDDEGSLFCWGRNYLGQLGTGGGARTTPIAISTADWREIDAGSAHTCAIRADDVVLCWGDGRQGQVGHGVAETVSTPTTVMGLPTGSADQITLGGSHSCVIVDGNAYCWGMNGSGQLGLSDLTNRVTPERLSAFTDGAVTDIAAGFAHTCAIVSDEVWCWGQNTRGQTGTGMGGPTPNRVTGLDGPWFVAAGEESTCVIDGSDQVVCWGSGADGRLGHGMLGPNQEPMPVTGIESASWLDMGAAHVCASSDDTVYCFGLGTSGQLGDERPVHVATPTLALLLTASGE
jgi:alpha-tubulin suppressor-like RCC1 family protein